jgi:hypothetical protein
VIGKARHRTDSTALVMQIEGGPAPPIGRSRADSPLSGLC